METNTKNRGFASMAAEKQREIARKGAQVENVVVDRRAGDEGAQAVAAGDESIALEQIESLAQRHQRDAELPCEAPLVVEALAGAVTAGDDALAQRLGDLVIARHATGQVATSRLRVF